MKNRIRKTNYEKSRINISGIGLPDISAGFHFQTQTKSMPYLVETFGEPPWP